VLQLAGESWACPVVELPCPAVPLSVCEAALAVHHIGHPVTLVQQQQQQQQQIVGTLPLDT
jgi:hypothetical protein